MWLGGFRIDIILSPGILGWLPVWFIIFLIIYHQNWKQTSWKSRRNLAIAVVLVPMTFLLPLHVWGTYSLIGLENGGIFVSGVDPWVVSFQLPPNTTYKSETLSNRYALETAYVGVTTFDDFEFYILDENIPDIQYEDLAQGGLPYSHIPYFTLAPYMIFPMRLPYYYSFLFVVANWTLNIRNPSLNTSINLTLLIHGSSRVNGGWAWRYFQFQGPTWAMLSLSVAYVSTTLVAYYYHDKSVP